MTTIFVFSLIVGGGLLALSMLGDVFGIGDADVDADFDLDTDIDADAPADPASGDLAGAFQIFTVRNLTYFLFSFGAAGWLLERMAPELSLVTIVLAAVLGGVAAAGLATVMFGWLKSSDSGYQPDDDSFVGCEGRVILPLARDRPGQIVVRRGAREHALQALPFDSSEGEPERWRSVVVIEMVDGTARVAPPETLAPTEGGPTETERPLG